MIVQDVSRELKTASFKKLAGYMLRSRHATLGLGVEWAKTANCAGTDIKLSIEETECTQQLNRRAVTNKTFHYIISFPEGEKPSREVLEDIENVLSNAIGFTGHQRLVAAHTDTPNFHLHVAINRVHPESFHCISPYYSHFRMQAAADLLEKKYGLTRENHVPFTREQPRKRPGWQREVPEGSVLEQFLTEYHDKASKAKAVRQTALKVLREQQEERVEKLKAWHRQRWDNARAAHLNRGDWSSTRRTLQVDAKRDWSNLSARHRAEKQDILARYPVPSLAEFRTAHHARDDGREAGVQPER
jgi:hypothetical protein